MFPGNEIDLNNLMSSRTPIDDYENLCNLDVLRVQDIPKTHEDMVHTNFKEQLKQSDMEKGDDTHMTFLKIVQFSNVH